MSLELVHAFGVIGRHGAPELGWRRFGVPPGGVFDRESWMLSNALIGLPPESVVWELGMANVRLRATEPGMVAVVGAKVAVTVDGHGAGSQAAFPIHAGAELHVGPPETGARVYVAFRPASVGRVRRLAPSLSHDLGKPLRVVAGPQADRFDLSNLTGRQLAIGMAANRVGIRLNGKLAPHDIELPSEPACPGSIQVTGDGGLVILGPDGPTIAGYPKIAVVIDADLDRAAQLRPGASVSFQAITLEEARSARRERIDRLSRLTSTLSISL